VNLVPRRGRRAPGLLAVLLALTPVGCSGGTDSSQVVFRIQHGVRPGAADQPCQLHQTDDPPTAYRGGPDSRPSLELPFLAYYTANGNKPYCDGTAASDIDRDWARLYVQLTGDAAAVRNIVSG
jgi:hypothetical protein